MSTNKRYSEDFKKTIVDLYNSGHSVKEISSEYGISDVAVYKWIKKFSPIDNSNDEITSLDDLEKLKKQIARLQEENTILKKAITIFAKE